MINRRDFLGITAGTGATLALTPELLRALQQQPGGTLIQPAPHRARRGNDKWDSFYKERMG